MLLNDDQVRLQHVIDSAREALGHISTIDRSAFEGNRLLRHGIVRCIEVIGEASVRLWFTQQAIHVFSMSDSDDDNDNFVINDLINDSVIACADTI